MVVRGVLLDYGHTLVDWVWSDVMDSLGEVYREHRRYLEQFSLHHLPPADELMEAVAMRMYREMDASYAAFEIEERDWLASFNLCLRDAGLHLPSTALAELVRREHAAFCRAARLPDDIPAVLAELNQRGLNLALVSNMDLLGDILLLEPPIRDLDTLIPVKVYSSGVGVRKPHPRIYEAALTGVGLRPDEVIFIGDRVKEDVRAPKAMGMRAGLTHQFRQEEDQQGEADFRVAHLRDLLDVIEELG